MEPVPSRSMFGARNYVGLCKEEVMASCLMNMLRSPMRLCGTMSTVLGRVRAVV